MATETQALQMNPFQERLLSIPEQFDVFLGGGRGGGKSYGLAYLALRFAEQWGSKARILYIRKTYRGLADFELTTRELFGRVYGTAARYNAAEHVWTFPNGAYMELGQLETAADYTKYHGRSFVLLLIDEAGQYSDPTLLDMMRSNLRGANKIPIRTVIAANPGGIGHHWLKSRYLFKSAAPWTPFYEEKSKREWVYAPSTFDGNDMIDREQYLDQLTSSCPDDAELLSAWRDGNWAIIRGAYFAECLSERNAIAPWDSLPTTDDGWYTYLSHDFGSSAPSVTYLIAKSPGAEWEGTWFPRGSYVLIDELATCKPNNPAVGMGWNVSQIASAIREFASKWDIAPDGVADDAIFARAGSSAGSIAEEFHRAGVYWQRAGKADRISGWQMMKRLLADAGEVDKPGLYVSRACSYFWATVPYIARDERRSEDVDTTSIDHAADACRYGLLKRDFVQDISVSWAQ